MFSVFAIGLINALRGSGRFKESTLGFLVSKWVCIVWFFLLMFLQAQNALVSGLFILPFIFMFATGTGGLLQAFTTDIKNPHEIDLADHLIYKIIGESVDSLAYCRKYGVWFGSFIGFIFFLPFIFTDFLYGLPMLLTGFAIGGLRYLPKIVIFGESDARWRLVEFLWFGFIYSLLFGLSV